MMTADEAFAAARAALYDARSILRDEVEELIREWESDQTHLDHRSGLRIAAAQLREIIDAGPELAAYLPRPTAETLPAAQLLEQLEQERGGHVGR